jgi:hypothetical protein
VDYSERGDVLMVLNTQEQILDALAFVMDWPSFRIIKAEYDTLLKIAGDIDNDEAVALVLLVISYVKEHGGTY